jgi:hypothetical protein
MAFWKENTAQPKRNYRFKVTITGLGTNANIWWAKGFKPPSYEVSEATHDYLDNKYYWPGRLTWNDCSMTLVDPQSPDAVDLTNQLIIDSGYKIKDGTSTSKPVTINRQMANTALGGGTATAPALGGVVVDIIDATGDVVESWELFNPFVKSVSFSDLAYDNDELRTIDISFRYDWAECTIGNAAAQFTP